MADLYAVAGSKIYIGTAVNRKSTVTAADFVGMDWTEIGGWTNAGAIGDTQQVIEQNVISENRTVKIKGTRNGGTMENQFIPDALDAGQIAFKSAIDSCKPHAFKVEWGAACPKSSVVTISSASPAVITWTAHELAVNQPVVFSTTGALPTGLTAGTTYYVRSAGLTADEFTVSLTPGGSAVNTSAAGSGTHTATVQPVGQTDMFYGLALPGAKQGGDANTAQLRNWSIAIDSNIVEV